MKQTKLYIYGKHAVREALLHAPNAVLKVFFEPRAADSELQKFIKNSGVATGAFNEGKNKADLRSGAPHQDVIGQISAHQLLVPFQQFTDALAPAAGTSLVLLNGVQDPHNVGAIIRSAAGFGASGVLMPQHSQAPVTGTVLKVSAGMAFRIPLVQVDDMLAAISMLKKKGFKIYALAGGGSRAITQEKFDAPALFIMGNEAQGVPPHIRALCDAVLSIPMSPRAESLNVAASAAIALYAWSVQHPVALLHNNKK